MAIAYEGIAGYIATTSVGDTVVNLEFDIDAGMVLLIAMPSGSGSSAQGPVSLATVWNSQGNLYYISNVVDDGANEWGYAAFPGFPLIGTMPMTCVTTPMIAGTDTVTVTIDIFNPAVSSPAFVSRILCFSGIPPYLPAEGVPILDAATPPGNTPPGSYTPIPLPALVMQGLTGVPRHVPRQEGGDPLFPDGILFGGFPGVIAPSEQLYVAAITWDGTSVPFDYYYGDANNSTFPTPSAAPGSTGLSSDGGAFNFTILPGDGTWVDLGNDTLGSVLETRYAYMINPNPPPSEIEISGDFDAAGGVWGASYDSENGGDYPYEPGSWNPPTPPEGDPISISAPVWPSLVFMEAIAGASLAGVPGIYATVAKGGATTGTGTFDPDTMVGISHVQKRGGAT